MNTKRYLFIDIDFYDVLSERFVKTDFRDGLTNHDANRVLELFK